MSLIGNIANYGGRQPDNIENVKQFVVSGCNNSGWIPKNLPTGLKILTPSDKTRSVYINTDLYVTGAIFNPSDEILKENISLIHKSISNGLFQLEPVTFCFKTDSVKKLHYGFIAQDIENIYPELVKNSEFGYKTVNYIELIPLLVSTIQNMQKEINELQKKLL